MTNPTPPLTAEEIVDQYSSVFYEHDTWMDYLISDIKAYAAQQNAELLTKCENLEAENERLKQHNKALIPLAAWSKKHGHELTCSIRKPIPDGVDRVVCNCGWVAAHNHSGLTTNQHIELAKYSDTQPPKEATACPDSCDDGYINGSGCCYKCL